MTTHLGVHLTQDFAQRLFADIGYPLTLVDDKEPFDPSKKKSKGSSESLNLVAYEALVAEASEKKTAKGWYAELRKFEKDYHEMIAACIASRDEAKSHKLTWSGPTEQEFGSLSARSDWDIAAALTKFSTVLKKAPDIKIQSPIAEIQSIQITVSATGELWAKHPWLKCTKKKYGICYKWKKIVKWTRIASLTVSPDLAADVRITFASAAGSIVAGAQFTRLVIHEGLFKKLNLAALANKFATKKSFLVVAKADFEIRFDSLKLRYLPTQLLLPPSTDGLSIEAELSAQ